MHKAYHAHIYFSLNELALAEQVRQAMITEIPELTYRGELVPRLVGPHPKPMFEIHFPAETFESTIEKLEQLRKHLDVLIHPVHDDHLKAHTEQARWLGKRLELNVEVFN